MSLEKKLLNKFDTKLENIENMSLNDLDEEELTKILEEKYNKGVLEKLPEKQLEEINKAEPVETENDVLGEKRNLKPRLLYSERENVCQYIFAEF